MIVAIAGDHAGLVLWQVVADAVESAGHQALRLGPHDGKPVDYCKVLTLGGRVMGPAIAADMTRAFVNAQFSRSNVTPDGWARSSAWKGRDV